MDEINSEEEKGIPIIVRYRNGSMMKCYTKDFYPTKDSFNITSDDGITHIIKIEELKAIFFVKSFEGDKNHIRTNEFSPESRILGRKLGVKFKDGEMLIGSSFSYNMENKGFFITPADADSNNKKVFIISDAVDNIVFLS